MAGREWISKEISRCEAGIEGRGRDGEGRVRMREARSEGI